MILKFGTEVKDLGNGKVGGYLCRYGSPEQTDLEGDYFTKETDFGFATTSPILYAHAQDATIKSRALQLETGTLTKDDIGVWIEGQLAQRDAYEKAIYGLVKSNKLGWSSGTAPHLVEMVKQKNGATWLKSWPLGLDASLTPRPAEPRNSAITIKSLILPFALKDVESLYDDAGLTVADDLTIAAISRLQDRLYYAMWDCLNYDATSSTQEKIANVTACVTQFADFVIKVTNAIYSGLSPQSQSDAAMAVKSLIGHSPASTKGTRPSTEREFERVLRDAGFSIKEAATIASLSKSLLRDAGANTNTKDTHHVVSSEIEALRLELLRIDCKSLTFATEECN